MRGVMVEFEDHKILMLGLWGAVEAFGKYKNIMVDDLYDFTKSSRKKFKLAEHLNKYIDFDMSQWYGDWKVSVDRYDTIIISSGIRGRDMVEFIRDRNPSARIIIYYENYYRPHERCAPEWYQGLGCEFYTFDPKNAKESNINFYHYFYPYLDVAMAKKNMCYDYPLEQDVFFLGMDDGRFPFIKQLASTFKSLSVKAQLLVVKSKHQKYAKGDQEWILQDRMDYGDSVMRILRSRAVLDIAIPNQSGITLRPMEAAFLGKKLITSNRDIIRYPFYNDKQVYIIQDDSMPKIKEFLESDIVPASMDCMEEYTPAGWLNNFFVSR